MADTTIQPAAGQLRLSSRRPDLINLSTLTTARSGVARSGVTRSGYTSADVTTFDPFLSVVIHDDDRTNSADVGDLTITMGLDTEPSEMSAVVIPRGNFEIRRGQEIRVYLGGDQTGVPLFGGHVLQVTERVLRQADPVEYEIVASDYHWLLDRYALVSKTYWNRGVNSIVHDLVNTYADPNSGFTVGYVPSSLGTVNFIEFDNLRLSDCIDKLSHTVDGGAFWSIDFEKRISMFTEPDDEGNALTVPETGGSWRHLSVERNLENVVNRVIFVGGGSKTTATASAGESTLSVEETGWFDPSGGSVRVASTTMTYTGLSVNGGAGDLQGVSGLVDDVPQGTNVWNLYQADDTTEQTALASDLGGSQSGVAVHEQHDHRYGYDRTQLAAESFLDLLRVPNTIVSYTQVPDDTASDSTLTTIRPGRLVTVSVVTPVVIAGSYRVRQVVLEPHARRADGSVLFRRMVTAQTNRRAFQRTMSDLIEGARVT